MKFLAVSTLMAAMASALPTNTLDSRQLLGSSNDLQQGSSSSCPGVIFIFARGSTEPGNMGSLGPLVARGLKSELGANGVWVQGVGGRYTAGIPENALPRGTTSGAIQEMTGLYSMAAQKCPNAKIVAGGYSQGAALAAAATTDIDSSIRSKIAGVVLFGYTKNLQNKGQIPQYPPENTKVFCNVGDLVCTGTLIVAAPHLMYQSDAATAAPQFLISRIKAAGAGTGAGTGGAGTGTGTGAGSGFGLGSLFPGLGGGIFS